MAASYKEQLEYIKRKCREYNADNDRTHLNVAKQYADKYQKNLDFIMSETWSQVEAVTYNGRLYKVKEDKPKMPPKTVSYRCGLGLIPERDCGCPKECCYSCGWNPQEEAERKKRIDHGGLISRPGCPRHLPVRLIKPRTEVNDNGQ